MSSLIFPQLSKVKPIHLERFIDSIQYIPDLSVLRPKNFGRDDVHLLPKLVDNLKYTPDLKDLTIFARILDRTYLSDPEPIKELFENIPKLEKLSFGGFDGFFTSIEENIHLLRNLKYLHLDLSHRGQVINENIFVILHENLKLEVLSLEGLLFAPNIRLPMIDSIKVLFLDRCDSYDLTLFRYFPNLEKLVIKESLFVSINNVTFHNVEVGLSEGRDMYDIVGEDVPILEKLVELEMTGRTTAHDMQQYIIKYLLEHFPNLEKFTIDCEPAIELTPLLEIVPRLRELNGKFLRGIVDFGQILSSLKYLRKCELNCRRLKIESSYVEENHFLEELNLINTTIDDLYVLVSKLPSLRKINLVRCKINTELKGDTEKGILRFPYGLELIEEFRVDNVSGLGEKMDDYLDYMPNLKVFECDFDPPKSINNESKIEVLKFTKWSGTSTQLKFFPNLRELFIGIINDDPSLDLIDNLHFTPNLEKLSISTPTDNKTIRTGERKVFKIFGEKIKIRFTRVTERSYRPEYEQVNPINIDILLEKIPNIKLLTLSNFVKVTFTKLHLCPKLFYFQYNSGHRRDDVAGDDIRTLTEKSLIANSYNEILWNPQINRYKNWYLRNRVETFINSNTEMEVGKTSFLPVELENQILAYLGTLRAGDPIVLPESDHLIDDVEDQEENSNDEEDSDYSGTPRVE